MHVITNLVVSELNLTYLREMKQQHDKDMKHYVACKMRHLITNLVVSDTPDYLLLDSPFLMAASFPLTHTTYSVIQGHIVTNPFLKITSRRFRWWWKKFSTNTL
jgi:hypothetical protein